MRINHSSSNWVANTVYDPYLVYTIDNATPNKGKRPLQFHHSELKNHNATTVSGPEYTSWSVGLNQLTLLLPLEYRRRSEHTVQTDFLSLSHSSLFHGGTLLQKKETKHIFGVLICNSLCWKKLVGHFAYVSIMRPLFIKTHPVLLAVIAKYDSICLRFVRSFWTYPSRYPLLIWAGKLNY